MFMCFIKTLQISIQVEQLLQEPFKILEQGLSSTVTAGLVK